MPLHGVLPTNILTSSEAEGGLPSHPAFFSDSLFRQKRLPEAFCSCSRDLISHTEKRKTLARKIWDKNYLWIIWKFFFTNNRSGFPLNWKSFSDPRVRTAILKMPECELCRWFISSAMSFQLLARSFTLLFNTRFVSLPMNYNRRYKHLWTCL